jgi:hypothetical protein
LPLMGLTALFYIAFSMFLIYMMISAGPASVT